MTRHLLAGAMLAVVLAGCSTLDALNPFSSSGPKMAELQPIETRADVRVLWEEGVGKGGDYTFVPAVVASSVYVAARDGTVARLDDGKQVWRIQVEQPLSGGVGADPRMLVVGTAKGDVLAFVHGRRQPAVESQGEQRDRCPAGGERWPGDCP
jgi:outer membrane protein assembly factor BamB